MSHDTARVVAERSLATICAVASSNSCTFAIVSSTQVVGLGSLARAGRPRSEPAMPRESKVRKLASTWRLNSSVQVPSIDARGTVPQRSSRTHPFRPRWTSCSSPVSSVFPNASSQSLGPSFVGFVFVLGFETPVSGNSLGTDVTKKTRVAHSHKATPPVVLAHAPGQGVEGFLYKTW